jgi:thiol-disulfide isomerase/thioredoxin
VHDQKEAVSGRSTGARGLAVAFSLALVAAGVVAVSRARAGREPGTSAAPHAQPAADTSGAGGPGYVLMDLSAIKRVVHGGKPVLVHFWASWCGPCLDELPLIDKFARDARARGVDFVSLSLDDPKRAGERVVRTLAQRAPTLTRNIVHVDDPDGFINTIDAEWEGAIPALFAYDPQGRLRGRLIGEASRRDLENLIARLVKPGK